jgi:hypothetical protein
VALRARGDELMPAVLLAVRAPEIADTCRGVRNGQRIGSGTSHTMAGCGLPARLDAAA